jgi:hypothetical protein
MFGNVELFPVRLYKVKVGLLVAMHGDESPQRSFCLAIAVY